MSLRQKLTIPLTLSMMALAACGAQTPVSDDSKARIEDGNVVYTDCGAAYNPSVHYLLTGNALEEELTAMLTRSDGKSQITLDSVRSDRATAVDHIAKISNDPKIKKAIEDRVILGLFYNPDAQTCISLTNYFFQQLGTSIHEPKYIDNINSFTANIAENPEDYPMAAYNSLEKFGEHYTSAVVIWPEIYESASIKTEADLINTIMVAINDVDLISSGTLLPDTIPRVAVARIKNEVGDEFLRSLSSWVASGRAADNALTNDSIYSQSHAVDMAWQFYQSQQHSQKPTPQQLRLIQHNTIGLPKVFRQETELIVITTDGNLHIIPYQPNSSTDL